RLSAKSAIQLLRSRGRDWRREPKAANDGHPDETDALGAALAALNRVVVDQESLDERLRRVAALTCTTISGCDMAAMTLPRYGRSSTDVCTDDTTKEIDAAQYASGSGPCLDAYRFQEPRRIGSTRADRRWPEFARAARE